MGSCISPIVATLFMEEFKTKAISLGIHPQMLTLRYVDDTFVLQKAEHSIQFLLHITSIDPHNQLTQETPNTEGSIPFLDTLVTSGPDNTLLTTIYKKTYPHIPILTLGHP